MLIDNTNINKSQNQWVSHMGQKFWGNVNLIQATHFNYIQELMK